MLHVNYIDILIKIRNFLKDMCMNYKNEMLRENKAPNFQFFFFTCIFLKLSSYTFIFCP